MKKRIFNGKLLLCMAERIFGRGFYRNSRAASDIALLYPGKEGRERVDTYYLKKMASIEKLAAVSIVFCVIAVVYSQISDRHIERIGRDTYGGAEKTVLLEAETAGGRDTEIAVRISPQRYSKDEAAERAREEAERMDERILGENESFDHVDSDLKLPDTIHPGPVSVRWEISNYSVMDINGIICSDAVSEEGTQILLKAVLTCQDEECEYKKSITVYSKKMTAQEQLKDTLSKAAAEADAETASSSEMVLPNEVNGYSLIWKRPNRYTIFKGLCFFILLTVAFYFLKDKKLHDEQERREAQMRADYPDILNKLALLLGAGMTVRAAWEKITADYTRYEKVKRYAYEEMLLCCHDMQRGTPEQEAYGAFGRRCGGSQYPKLASMMSQNLKKGTAGLVKLFRSAAEDSFADRKNYAKAKAEEAGTKLLLPMFLMLAVVIVLIIIPAFMSISL